MAAAEDQTGAALLWQAKITLRVVLADNDIAALEAPPPLYLQVPRQGYLHSVLDTIDPLIRHALVPGTLKPWFSYNNLPLRWNLPTGVLFDLLAPNHGFAPWTLTLHVTAYPTDVMPPCAGPETLRSSMINSLKEASFVVCKSADPVNKATALTKEALWAAVVAGDERKYRENVESLWGARPVTQALPVRVLIRPATALSSYEPVAETSRRVASTDADGEPTTLSNALAPIVSSWLAARGAESDPWAAVSRVLIGGVEPPPDAPLAALHRDLHAPDYFLYVVLHMKPV